MTKEEMFEMLKDNLKLETRMDYSYPNRCLCITIRFDGKKISETMEIIGHDY